MVTQFSKHIKALPNRNKKDVVGKGTGMGMSLSYQIVTNQHRGKLECFSTLGEGTAIILQLPCVFEESSNLADGKKKTT